MWQPNFIKYSLNALPTSTGVVRVMTDAGIGYLKALGNDQGPHALAREFIGTSIAHFLGLITFEFSIIEILPDDELQLGNGGVAHPGPAFISKEMENSIQGFVDLKKVDNAHDFTGLVVADMLLLNRDRHPGLAEGKPNVDNLLFRKNEPPEKGFKLIAMDFSHCLHVSSSLNRSLEQIHNIKSEEILGLFPEFRQFISKDALLPFLARLRLIDEGTVKGILEGLPLSWDVSAEVKKSVINFLVQRANFLYDNIERLLATEIYGKLFL